MPVARRVAAHSETPKDVAQSSELKARAREGEAEAEGEGEGEGEGKSQSGWGRELIMLRFVGGVGLGVGALRSAPAGAAVSSVKA